MDKKKRIFEAIDGYTGEMVELQRLLTRIPAIGPENGGEGEEEKALSFIGWMKERDVELIETLYAPDPRVPAGKRPNVIARFPGKDSSRTLWIMSHLDVVPEGELSLWNTDPFSLVEEDGKLYGRGVEDNQQGIVSSIFAALAFTRTGTVPDFGVNLLFVADEEFGSNKGIKYLLKEHNLFRENDMFLVPDGGRPDGTMIEVAEKSVLWLEFKTTGKQTHASRPDMGKNAFLAASDLVMRLSDLKSVFSKEDPLFEPPTSTFNPTKKEANVPNVNTIPGEDVFCFDCRILPDYPADEVLAEVDRRVGAVEETHGVGIEYKILQRVESRPTPADAEIVGMLKNAVTGVYGTEAEPVGIGGGTVAAYLRNEGYETVVWARHDETAHNPNENCRIENLVGDAKVMASLMLKG
jgi:succinyl-diaminopimelate desuccinylase